MKKNELTEISHKLKKGDYTRITEIVGCSMSMVKYVFKSERNVETNLAQKIITVAKQMIEQREELTNQFQKQD